MVSDSLALMRLSRFHLLCAAVVALPSICVHAAPAANPAIEPAAAALVKSVATKLEAATTVALQARHTLHPSLGSGNNLDKGPIAITMARPNKFHAVQPAGRETREIAYDGSTFIVMSPQLGHHATAKLPAKSMDELASMLDKQFGFRPPVAELLSENLPATLFSDATSAKVLGVESIGWKRYEHVQIVQKGMITDIWIGSKDKLPHRLLYTYTDLPGNPTWDIGLTKWKLNAPVDTAAFSKKPAADSMPVQMLKAR